MLGHNRPCGAVALVVVVLAAFQFQETALANGNAAPPLQNVNVIARSDARDLDFGKEDEAPLPALQPRSPLPSIEPFGVTAITVTNGAILTKWRDLEADLRNEAEILDYCRDHDLCPPAVQKLLEIIAEGRARSGRARIGVINRAVNMAIRPTSDFAQWGVPDHWSAPLETFATARGDCEDYAIAKYVALREAGIAEDDIRLLVVRDLTVNEDHAIAAVRLDEDWIVLDNRWLALARDTELHRLVPLFVLDGSGVKQFIPQEETAFSTTAMPWNVHEAPQAASYGAVKGTVIVSPSRRRQEEFEALLWRF
jgi:predicted transglutaminase-like cysteine proteinase